VTGTPETPRPSFTKRVLTGATKLLPERALPPIAARTHRRVEPEMGLLIDRCDPNGIVLDIGAWYGPWTTWLSKKVTAVHAFEPNPRIAKVLRSSVRSNVTIHEVALSDSSGTSTLFNAGGRNALDAMASLNGSTEFDGEGVEIMTSRVDDFDFSDVRFVKIDVEGHEHRVLLGAAETLARETPVVFVELEERFTDIDRTITFMEELGYEGRFWMDGSWTSTSDVDLSAWQRDFHATQQIPGYLSNVLHGSPYVNDVAFVHPLSTWSPWR